MGTTPGALASSPDRGQVGVERAGREAGHPPPVVAGGQVLARGDRAGEYPAAERAVGDDADAELAAEREHLGLDVPGPQRPLGLYRADGADGVGAARPAFTRLGYDGVGVREIAGQAGVDTRLITRYFGDTERLIPLLQAALDAVANAPGPVPMAPAGPAGGTA
jgi:Bacterial regulatory proteins, tetR family